MANSHATLLALLSSLFLIRATADAVISGVVFCDLCRDGGVTFLDYPLFGAKVAVACVGGDGRELIRWAEQTTGFAGTFGMRLEGNPDDMGRCSVRVVEGPPECNAGEGPPQGLRPVLRFFGADFYTVEPLLSQPSEPMSFCRRPVALPRLPPPSVISPPPPVPPTFACPHEAWMEPEHICEWKVVRPETPVAVAFGVIAGQRYGMGMTLWEGLEGRGELYRTLLREGTTALLNSYRGYFRYPPWLVVGYVNRALVGSPSLALEIATRLRSANSAAPSPGHAACTLTPCGGGEKPHI